VIENCTLLRIDRRTGATPAGDEVRTVGTPINGGAGVRGFAGEVSSSQKFTLGSAIKDATAVCYVPQETLQEAGEDPVDLGDVLVLLRDLWDATAGSQECHEVLLTKVQTHGVVSHFELYTKRV
jgi:hypothetical protein